MSGYSGGGHRKNAEDACCGSLNALFGSKVPEPRLDPSLLLAHLVMRFASELLQLVQELLFLGLLWRLLRLFQQSPCSVNGGQLVLRRFWLHVHIRVPVEILIMRYSQSQSLLRSHYSHAIPVPKRR